MSRRRERTWPVNTGLTVVMIGVLLPIYWLLKSGFSSNDELFRDPPQVFPWPVVTDGFAKVWPELSHDLLASAYIALGTVALALVVSIPTAYGMFLLRGQNGASGSRFLIMISLAFPSMVFVIPLYQLLYSWHLLNTVWGLIIADTTYSVPLAIMLIYTYMLTLPAAALEAAAIDGINLVGMLWRIVIPLTAPALTTSAIFAFLFGWSDFLFAVTFGAGRNTMPATVAVYSLIQGNNGVTAWPQVMAGSIVVALPALVAILLAQRFIPGGLTAGAVK